MGISQNLDRLVALHRSRLRSHGETEFFRQQIVDRHLRLHGSHYFSCFGRLDQRSRQTTAVRFSAPNCSSAFA